MDFDKHITNSSNLMKTSCNLINKELGTGQKTMEFVASGDFNFVKRNNQVY